MPAANIAASPKGSGSQNLRLVEAFGSSHMRTAKRAAQDLWVRTAGSLGQETSALTLFVCAVSCYGFG